jgi:hypothetical protein
MKDTLPPSMSPDEVSHDKRNLRVKHTIEKSIAVPITDLRPPILHHVKEVRAGDRPDSAHVLAHSTGFTRLRVQADTDDMRYVNEVGVVVIHEFLQIPINDNLDPVVNHTAIN